MPLFDDPAFLLHPGYIAGQYYATYPGSLVQTTPGAVDTVFFYPVIFPHQITFTAARARIQTGGAGSSMKTGIWENYAPTMRPVGAPVAVDNTGIATTSSTTDSAITMSGTLQAGQLYWIGTKFTGTLPGMWCVPNSNAFIAWLTGLGTGALNSASYSIASTYSNNMPTLATNASLTVGNSLPIHIWLAT